MTTLLDIFKIRVSVDSARQPDHASRLEQLVSLLNAMNEPHPYGLTDGAEQDIIAQLGCPAGPTGDPVSISGSDYLYRLSSLGGVMIATGWEDLVPDAHAAAMIAYRDQANWLRLSQFTTGHVANERGFSWWTTLDTLLDDPFRAGHHLGLLDNWIAVHSVIMRCPIDAISGHDLACIPSPTDALSSPIYASVSVATAPTSGVTIDLRGTGPAGIGAPEYALRPVPVEIIEFIPVRIPEEHRTHPRVPKDTATWQRLMPFYESLSNE